MKAAIVLILVCALGAVWGAWNVYRGVRDRDLVEISCADYVTHRPTSRWVKLVDCEADFSRTLEVRDDDSGDLDAVYVALRARGADRDTRAQLVIQSDGKRPPIGRSYQGLMRIGALDEPADSFHTRLQFEIGAAPDAVVLDLGAEPHIWLGLLALIGGSLGLAIAAWLIWSAIRS